MTSRSGLIPLAILLAISLARPATAVEPGAPDVLFTEEMALGIKVREALRAAKPADEAEKARIDALDSFYAARHNKPLWLVDGGYGLGAKRVLAVLASAEDYGLKAADYPAPAEAGATADSRADAEMRLSLAALHYANDAHVGPFKPEQISPIINRGSTTPDPLEVLAALADTPEPDTALLGYHPKHPQFEALRKLLIEARDAHQAAAAEPEEKVVEIPDGPLLRPGMRHPQVALLRERLDAPIADDQAAEDAELYDDALVEAVRKFQTEHELTVDGLVGRGVRSALNGRAPISESNDRRVERILVNMLRWRWINEDLGSFYVMNNVPEYLTRVFDNGRLIFTERIVVGKPDTATPTFSDQMEYIEFNPFWNVPNSIKVQEILPGLRSGNGIMSAQNLRVQYNGRPIDPDSVDWSAVDIRKFHFFQPPGGPNVLGVVKFMFPNPHDVYMHDTSSRGLFGETTRTFSHGCMRVRNPLEFARVLLGHDKGWGMSDVNAALAGGNRQVVLTTPIPVHIAYFTAWVGEDGGLKVFNDPYGYDRRIAMALNGETKLLSEEEVARAAASRIRVAGSTGPGFYEDAEARKKKKQLDPFRRTR